MDDAAAAAGDHAIADDARAGLAGQGGQVGVVPERVAVHVGFA